jgi:FkbM family methyltransferase
LSGERTDAQGRRVISRNRQLKRKVFRALLRPVPFGLKVWIGRHLFHNLGAYLPPGHERVVPDYLGEFRVIANSSYPIERGLLISRYEPVTLSVIDAFVNDGDVCFDIGANVGALTLPMARRVGAGGKVYAFEPGPPAYERLVRNLSLNSGLADRVVPLQLGVGAERGTLHWAPGDNANPADATLLQSTGVPVRVVTVDAHTAAERLTKLDFVKIDVEGMEYEVLLGGRATWAAHRPVFYLETERRFDAIRAFPALERIEALLRELGYELYRVGKDMRLTAVTAATMGGNTLAVPVGDRRVENGRRLRR